MPLDFGARQLVEENYATFTGALGQLAAGERDTKIRQGRGGQEIGPPPRTITAPGWQDIVKLGPPPAVSRDQWGAYFGEQRGEGAARLPPAVRAEIERRINTIERIQTSATPPWAETAGQLLVSIDNVQDLLSTIAVAGRMALGPLARSFPALLAPFYGAALAASLLNILALLGLLAIPLYGLICRGASEAVAAGVPALVRAGAMKGMLGRLGSLSLSGRGPLGRVSAAEQLGAVALVTSDLGAGAQANAVKEEAARLRASSAFRPPGAFRRGLGGFAGGRFGVSNAIEAVQVTGDLFGYGMVFGGLMGQVSDSAFGAEQAIRGEAPELRTPTRPAFYQALFADYLGGLSAPALIDGRTAAGLLVRLPLILDPASPLTLEERIAAAFTGYAAWELLVGIIQHPNAPAALAAAEEDTWTPPEYSWDDTAGALVAAGRLDPASVEHWPVAGAPRRLTGHTYTAHAALAVERALIALDARGPDDSRAGMLAHLLALGRDRALILFYDTEEIELGPLAPEWAFAESLAAASVVVNVGQDAPKIAAVYSRYLDWRAATGKQLAPAVELHRWAGELGLVLIPLLEADAPLPPALAAAQRA